jgi:hypothetical protein
MSDAPNDDAGNTDGVDPVAHFRASMATLEEQIKPVLDGLQDMSRAFNGVPVLAAKEASHAAEQAGKWLRKMLKSAKRIGAPR